MRCGLIAINLELLDGGAEELHCCIKLASRSCAFATDTLGRCPIALINVPNLSIFLSLAIDLRPNLRHGADHATIALTMPPIKVGT